MSKLNAQQIHNNWNNLITLINEEFEGDRKEQLKKLYSDLEDIIIMAPASAKKEHHNSFPGGYVDHVLRVIKISKELYILWEGLGAITDNFTLEELIFSALNHDLGKIGDGISPFYIPQDNEWRSKNLNEYYKYNSDINYMSVPHRSIYILQNNNIKISMNEMIGILIHDGLYDPGNESYYKTYSAETKLRTNLPLILHQADMMASRIEFEGIYSNLLRGVKDEKVEVKISNEVKPKNFKLNANNNISDKNKALKTLKSTNLKNILDTL